jgi:hypothetical protein
MPPPSAFGAASPADPAGPDPDQKSMPPMPPMPARHAAGLSLGGFADRRFGGDQQAGHRGGVLQRGPHDLGGVDHAGGDEILVHFRLRVEADRLVIAVDQLAGDDGAVMARILGDLADRRLQRAADDVDAAGLVVIAAG